MFWEAESHYSNSATLNLWKPFDIYRKQKGDRCVPNFNVSFLCVDWQTNLPE